MLLKALVIFGISLAGGCVPLVLGVRDHLRRSLLAVATGVLLGALFLHLLPELAHLQLALEPEPDLRALWLIVIAVVVGLGLADAILCRREGDSHGHEEDHEHHHVTASLAAFIGLSIHSFTEGLSLAGTADSAQLAFYSSIVAHKAAESFSLSTIFALAHFQRRKIFALQFVYALITPLGVLLGDALSGSIGEFGHGALAAITCGTFLFIGLCELLPDTFHRRERAFHHLVLVAAGVGFVVWFS